MAETLRQAHGDSLSSSSMALAPAPPPGPPMVTVKRVMLQQALDASKRAATAARQAQRLCSSAEQAFHNEGLNLGDCTAVLQRVLESGQSRVE